MRVTSRAALPRRTSGLSVDVRKRLSARLLLQDGGELYADEVRSTRVDLDMRTGAERVGV
jgi:hypothetical protein